MWSSFGWSKKRNFLESLALSIGHFSEGLVWSDYLEKWKAAINCPTIVANTSKIGKFLVRIIFIPWDTFIICKVNKKPGQMYQKCLITYSVAVLFGRCRISPIISGLNSRLLWSSLGWSTKRKFSEGPALRMAPFQKVQREVIYFPCVVTKKWKAAINWPKIVAYTIKIVKYLGRMIFEHL